MKYFYLKGMNTTKAELDYIRSKFNEYNIDLINLVDDYAIFNKMSEDEIVKYITDKINVYEDDVSLISHSMGCNFVSLIWTEIPNLKRVTMISPEFKDVTKEEKAKIEKSINEDKHPFKQKPLSLNKIMNIKMFLRTKDWLQRPYTALLPDSCPVDIFYSKGDKFVSHDAIKKYSNINNVTSFEIDSNNHNPLLETNEIIERIADNNVSFTEPIVGNMIIR